MTYTIHQSTVPAHWDAIQDAAIAASPWGPPPTGLRASAKACYSDERLMFRLQAWEAEPLARFDGLLDMVCRDSCLEFFCCPAADDSRYFNFEFNPNGALYLGFARDRGLAARQVLPHYRTLFEVRPFRFTEGWGIDFSIPASFIALYFPSFHLERGVQLRGNFYKCGDETTQPHYLAWKAPRSEQPDFHRPQDFGALELA